MKRKFDLETVRNLVDGFTIGGFIVVARDMDGEWRWGTEHYIVFKDFSDYTLWRLDYREPSGDAEYDWEDYYSGECYEVNPQEVVTVKYVATKE